jgi:hypothetical protein
LSKKSIPVKLSTQFTLAAIAAMAVGIVLFFVISYCGSYILRAKLESTEYIEQKIEKKVDEFQRFVTENNITTEDMESVEGWVQKEKNVMLAVHDEGKVIFDSTFSWRKKHSDEEMPPPHTYRNLYTVNFADKTAYVEMFVLIEFKFMVVVNYCAIFIAIVAFLLLFTSFI